MQLPLRCADEPLWIYPKNDPELKEKIAKEFKVHPVVAQILISRGFTSLDEIHQYLYAKLPDLYDPFLLAEMPKAVDRIAQVIQNKESILIYGDNDVDGMTGTALLTEFLQFIGVNVFFYVSNRGMRRQSLIIEALEYALKNNCRLIVTVDCGITAAAEVAKVAEAGVDVIITDHHEPTDTIPHCIATLNPKLLQNAYPNRDLTGVGVAFKLAHAITNHLISEGRLAPKKVDLKRYLDLVALGTISDMGALMGENRILVGYGLRQLRKTKRIGLAKLISIAGVELEEISAYDIAAKIAPRLNSLGRIDNPQKGVEMLLIRNAALAEKLAFELDLNNLERQKIEKLMVTDVENMFTLHPEILKHKAIVMDSDKWHPGIIAILSTRVSKLYNRPAVMIAIDREFAKGSLRSIHTFRLLGLLKELSPLLLNFGGHDFAAGLTLKQENIEEFKRRFIQAADEMLSESDVMPKLMLDAEVQFDELTFDFMESIKLLEPFGNENPPPVLYTMAKQAWPPKVVGNHVKFYLQQENRLLEGMAFNKASQIAKWRNKRNPYLNVAFTPHVNNYQGPSIQLLIRELQPIAPP
jgi:single-stranded-DNA-specific exonuclease